MCRLVDEFKCVLHVSSFDGLLIRTNTNRPSRPSIPVGGPPGEDGDGWRENKSLIIVGRVEPTVSGHQCEGSLIQIGVEACR